MRQYVVVEAYTDNYHVIAVEDGKVVSDSIVAYYEVDGYTKALEQLGYTKSYFVPAAHKEFFEAELAYKRAKENYEEAQANALKINEDDAKKVACFKEFFKAPDDLY